MSVARSGGVLWIIAGPGRTGGGVKDVWILLQSDEDGRFKSRFLFVILTSAIKTMFLPIVYMFGQRFQSARADYF